MNDAERKAYREILVRFVRTEFADSTQRYAASCICSYLSTCEWSDGFNPLAALETLEDMLDTLRHDLNGQGV